jgi:hypothetical protein
MVTFFEVILVARDPGRNCGARDRSRASVKPIRCSGPDALPTGFDSSRSDHQYTAAATAWLYGYSTGHNYRMRQPAFLFEKFPKHDLFITDKDGH